MVLVLALAVCGSSAAGLLAAVPGGPGGSGSSAVGRSGTPDFNKEVRPILAENCFKCHGPDDSSRKAKLRLDTRESALASGKSGKPAIVPGQADASELVRRIVTKDTDDLMPPPDTGKKLSTAQIETLRAWVTSGAVYKQHWAFVAPIKQPVPDEMKKLKGVKGVKGGVEGWGRQPWDALVQARLERENVVPAKEADKATLARRAALDLTGLPPAPGLFDAFVRDTSPQAYEHYVDGLLASPAYGERWAAVWLDLARFADTKGYEKDLKRTLWRYRDWLIDAFNADMPYDQFTREQLAGDLLPNPSVNQLLATAFHRNTMVNDEGGTDDEEFRIAAVKDRVDTTMQVWMGVTMGCAKCHTHKYDPISNREYYEFYAFFNQTEDADRYDDAPTLPTPTAEQSRELERLRGQLADAEKRLAEPTPEIEGHFQAWRELAARDFGWTMLSPLAGALAASGSVLEPREDGSLVAKGPGPDRETYVVRYAVTNQPGGGTGSLRLTGLRLDVLPDKASPRGAVGRARDDGNFVLTGLRLSARLPDGGLRPVEFSKATADFAQDNYPVDHVLKNPDPKKHGWAISPKQMEAHTAVFQVATPLDLPGGSELTLTLEHDFEFGYPGFSIGRFRVGVTSLETPQMKQGLPVEVVSLLGKADGELSASERARLLSYYSTVAPEHAGLRAETERLRGSIAAVNPPSTPIMRELPADKRRVTRIHKRGNFLDQGDEVKPSVPAAFHPWPKDASLNRLGVAQWLTSRDNPLTARVAVNRVWAHMFGTGIVQTQEDFGTQGTAPTHQELLDWLAVDFMEGGWSFKRLCREIALSATYRQGAQVSAQLAERDRFNRLLARGPRFRLEGELIRDQALSVAGLLSSRMYGPSVMPYQPDGLWKSTYNNDRWVTSPGEDRHRRALYTFVKRTTPYPFMLTFDGTSREVCTLRRIPSNTPLQALNLMNDPVFVEAAQGLARRMALEGGARVEDQIAFGMRAALLRAPTSAEIRTLVALYRQRVEAGAKDAAGAEKLATVPLGPLPVGQTARHLGALTAVANVILNLDEFLSKG